MKALIVSLESFQKGEIPPEVIEYIQRNKKRAPFIILDESSKIKTNEPCKESKKSKRTQAVLKLNKIGERCILTGTFMSKSPVNAYDQMKFLKDDFFPETIYLQTCSARFPRAECLIPNLCPDILSGQKVS